ncbi:MAG: SH3 domain-containing protein [Pseudomonadota bacterium]|nr:SH3 domain-containing protein [Pseudomonadota bacterium]
MSNRYSFARSGLGCFAAAALLLGTGSASATADGPDFYSVTGVADDDVLNIRAEPDAHAKKIGEIPPDGTCVRNLGCQGGLTFREFTELTEEQKAKRLKENPRWGKIEYQGVNGWVAGRYLREGTCRE